jgi:hypothetical protein
MNKIIKIALMPLIFCVLLILNLSMTSEKNEYFSVSCVTVTNSAQAGIFGPGSILNRHELAFEYPEMWDAGIIALCYGWGLDCAFEGETTISSE